MSLFSCYNLNGHLEAGVDESGCGCLAGPVFASAVILPADFNDDRIKDSKKLSPKKREKLAEFIRDCSIAYSVEMVPVSDIDTINILRARIKAMHMALERLHIQPEYIIIDGDKFQDYHDVPYSCIIGGDNLYYSIAAASILAKTERDKYMLKLDKIHPQYGWVHNKGYGTKDHFSALHLYGPSEFHRKSYAPVRDCLRSC